MNGKDKSGQYSVKTRSSSLKQKPVVEFDVSNREHVVAMMDLIIHMKQHPTIRFELKHPFESVTEMGKVMLACHAANIITGRNFSEQAFLDTVVPEMALSDIDNNVFVLRPGVGSGPSKSTH